MQRQSTSRQVVSEKLKAMGLVRLDTAADGNCQFIALAYSAGMSISHAQLRAEICSYLSSMEELFSGLWDRRWETYSAYVQHMSRDGSWGDELTLQCASHLFLRPIRIVSDNPDEVDPKLFRTFYPPDSIAADCWGPLITLAFLQFSHYEATEKPK